MALLPVNVFSFLLGNPQGLGATALGGPFLGPSFPIRPHGLPRTQPSGPDTTHCAGQVSGGMRGSRSHLSCKHHLSSLWMTVQVGEDRAL